jgi:archaellum component FlaC
MENTDFPLSLLNLVASWMGQPLTLAWVCLELVSFVAFWTLFLQPVRACRNALEFYRQEITSRLSRDGEAELGPSARSAEILQALKDRTVEMAAVRSSGVGLGGKAPRSQGKEAVSRVKGRVSAFVDSWQANLLDLDDGGGERSAAVPEDHLDSSRLLPEQRDLGDAAFVPGFLTSLGILGTFVGLAIGVIDLSPTINSNTDDSLRAGVANLIESMGTAFGSSVMGILLALVWIGLQRRFSKSLRESVVNLCGTLREALPAYREADLIRAELYLARVQKDSIETIAMDISTQVVEGFREVVESVLVPSLNQVDASVKAFGNQDTDAHLTALEKLMKDFQEGMAARLETQAENLDKSIQTLEGSITGLLSGVSELLDRIKQVYAEVERTANTQAEAVRLIDQSARNFTASLEAIGELHAQLASTAETSAETGRKLAEVQAEAVNLHGELRTAVAPLSDLLTKLAGTFEQMQEKLSVSASSLEDALGRFDQSIDGVSKELREVLLDGVRESLAAMQQAVAATAKDLETGIRRSVGEALAGVSDSLQPAIADLQSVVEKIEDGVTNAVDAAAQSGDKLAQSVEELSSNATTLATGISAEMSKSVGALEDASSRFREDALRAISALEEQIGKAVDQNFRRFDKELALLATHLSGTVEESNGTLEELREFLGQIPGTLKPAIDELRSVISEGSGVRTAAG